ncbi:Amidase [Only Syngen Nebraska virus 5]|uniref:Amidase n=1 Tax=Only Syngen Nebraska virus 5 TaxID=1917232 RepID=UPI000901949C|nr:Amidase [Only Syngen Nebraska virus 5]APC25648.1 Amidase [Only Syngen Nebraska virus 5]
MCSGLRVIADDGTVVVGRTLEFGENILKFRKFVNGRIRGISTPDGKLLDGINKFGLVVMVFYFKNYAKYGCPSQTKLNIKPTEVSLYLLENAKNIKEVAAIVPKLNVVHETFPPFTETPPMHWFVTDNSGKSVVLEPSDNGKISLYENKMGIMTNSPTFPEHMSSATKALEHLSPISDPNAPSQGTGALGLPGDFSSESRFIRLAFFSQTVEIPRTSAGAVNTVFHVLNNFDIPKGVVASINMNTGKHVYEKTIYTAVYNLKTKEIVFKDYNNQVIRKL